ncbi:helix-turn-helix domain-containing protein [Streptomyces sp. Inha503]|uniref:helix-turn-helix domain-containing protein n=1 Tax=Streptomyces sp. Inha503 TaxID=3383314 RepID=UPI0039A16987
MTAPGNQIAMWERFQAGDPVQVRPEIHASWRRSRLNGIDPERLDLGHTDIDPEQLIVRAGAPILLGVTDRFVGTSTALALADPSGTVVWRWEAHDQLSRTLDGIDFALGSDVGETSAGTNGIGVAATTARTSVVVGAEHFKQAWHGWACVATPVIDPATRTVAGSVNIACPAPDANRLLVVVARGLAADVGTAIGRRMTARQHRLLDSHLAFCAARAGTVVSIDARHMITEDEAAPLGLDRATLWAAVNEVGPAAKEIVLGDVHARIYPVVPGSLGDGVVLVLGRGTVPGSIPRSTKASLSRLEEAEARVILEALAESDGNKSSAAARLGISRGTLYQRLRRYGIR